jgi:translation elongation factor EF-Tu-like GTPase
MAVTLKENLTDKFTVSGRGTILTANKHDYTDEEYQQLKIGNKVIYKGETYEITGIEMYWKPISPPIPGDNIGLIVKGMPRDE